MKSIAKMVLVFTAVLFLLAFGIVFAQSQETPEEKVPLSGLFTLCHTKLTTRYFVVNGKLVPIWTKEKVCEKAIAL